MGRTLAALLAAVVLGCGAQAVVDPIDGGPANTAPTDSVGGSGGSGGCPTTPPSPGAPCTGGVYYCHYFTNDDACVDSIKCTFKGAAHIWVGGGGGDCTFKGAACAEGLACGRVFEPEGACLVKGERACQCDGPTGKLRCRSL